MERIFQAIFTLWKHSICTSCEGGEQGKRGSRCLMHLTFPHLSRRHQRSFWKKIIMGDVLVGTKVAKKSTIVTRSVSDPFDQLLIVLYPPKWGRVFVLFVQIRKVLWANILVDHLPLNTPLLFLASQDAPGVMGVTHWVTHSLDVSRVDWCDPGEWGYWWPW